VIARVILAAAVAVLAALAFRDPLSAIGTPRNKLVARAADRRRGMRREHRRAPLDVARVLAGRYPAARS
jgi:hypothetical protein